MNKLNWIPKNHALCVRNGSALLILAFLGGCISIETPEEPIVIELNINIEARVLYELADDAASTIDENEEIF